MNQVLSASRRVKPKVLVVEDEPLVRLTLVRGFRASGFEVFTADSFLVAERLAQEVRPSVAVLDMVLPDGCGLDLVRAWRDLLRIPTILLTASVCPALRARAAALGACAYVVKPVPVDEIVLAARSAMENPARAAALH